MVLKSVALGVAVAALVAAVAWRHPAVKSAVVGAANLVGVSLTPANSDIAAGPSYLVSNQPWMMGDPASAVLTSVGQMTNGGSVGYVPQFDPLNKTYS